MTPAVRRPVTVLEWPESLRAKLWEARRQLCVLLVRKLREAGADLSGASLRHGECSGRWGWSVTGSVRRVRERSVGA